MDNGLIVGICIAVVNVIVVVGAYIYKTLEWKKTVPKIYVGNMGVKYVQGGKEWEGMEKVVKLLNSKLASKYGEEFAKKVLDHTWIEVVGPEGVRHTATTIVSEANKIAGSIDSVKKFPFPWCQKYDIAVVLQRDAYKTADDGAIFHEIVKHIVPIARGQGANADHKMKEYIALETDLHFAYKQMKDQ